MAENCAPFRKEQEEGDEVVIDEEEDNSLGGRNFSNIPTNILT